MLMPSTRRNVPFGVVTLVLVASVVLFQWTTSSGLFAASDYCDELKASLKVKYKYFLHWQAPNLLLVLSDKKQWQVQASDQQAACRMLKERMSEQLSAET